MNPITRVISLLYKDSITRKSAELLCIRGVSIDRIYNMKIPGKEYCINCIYNYVSS
jgi:hypothetical protein